MRTVLVPSGSRSRRGDAVPAPLRAAAVLGALLLAACGGVFSKAPASDDGTSRADDRLIGFWRADVEAEKEGEEKPSGIEAIFAVGRKAGAEKVFAVAMVEIRADKTLETTHSELLATTVAGREHASLRVFGSPPKPEDPPAWVVVRYEMPDADTLRVLSMDETAVAADVRGGAIAGTVSESKTLENSPPTYTVTLDATTNALRAWLEKRGDEVYRTSRPLVLRRLRLR